MSAEVFIVDPLQSNSMKSRNPHSGFHREDVSMCLDTSTQNPIRNGGGALIVQRVSRKLKITQKRD